MIEVRPYRGPTAPLVELIGRAWGERYEPRDLMPAVDAPGLEWQCPAPPPEGDSLHLAAWHGERLVGCFLAEIIDIKLNSINARASQGSWFSVLSGEGGSAAAFKLIGAMERRHRELGLAFFLGYVNCSPTSPARRFWGAYARLSPSRYREWGPLDLWMRFLDHDAALQAVDHPLERLGLGLLGRIQGAPEALPPCVRPYEPRDRDALLALLEQDSSGADLAPRWSPEALDAQLTDPRHDPPQAVALVYDEGGVKGLASTFRWALRGRQHMPLTVLDLLVTAPGQEQARRALLRGAAALARRQGSAALARPALSRADAASLAGAGFVPVPQAAALMTLFADPALAPPARPCQLRFR